MAYSSPAGLKDFAQLTREHQFMSLSKRTSDTYADRIGHMKMKALSHKHLAPEM